MQVEELRQQLQASKDSGVEEELAQLRVEHDQLRIEHEELKEASQAESEVAQLAEQNASR